MLTVPELSVVERDRLLEAGADTDPELTDPTVKAPAMVRAELDGVRVINPAELIAVSSL